MKHLWKYDPIHSGSCIVQMIAAETRATNMRKIEINYPKSLTLRSFKLEVQATIKS